MKTFTDSNGRDWTLTVNVGEAKRVNALLDIDILQLHEGDPPLLTRLHVDYILLVDVIFAFVKPQADAAGITDEQFAACLTGDGLLAAHEALMGELEDFFRQLHRTDMARMIQVEKKLVDTGVELASRKIDALDLDALLKTTLSGSATSSPGDSASTRPR